MNIEDVREYFGGSIQNIANALGISRTAVAKWQTQGNIPKGRQYQLHCMSNGVLKLDHPVSTDEKINSDHVTLSFLRKRFGSNSGVASYFGVSLATILSWESENDDYVPEVRRLEFLLREMKRTQKAS
ncbi:MAG: Cro/CI family transcriptional regulator [Pseudomonadota bacterium]